MSDEGNKDTKHGYKGGADSSGRFVGGPVGGVVTTEKQGKRKDWKLLQ